MLSIRLEDEDELENFEEAQYSIAKPLHLLCEDAELLEKALRMYQGIAMYTGDLPAETLETLHKKYGLIVLN